MSGIRKPDDGEPYRRMLIEHRLGYRQLRLLMVKFWFENEQPVSVPPLADLELFIRYELWAWGRPCDEGPHAESLSLGPWAQPGDPTPELLVAARHWARKAVKTRWPDIPER
jgi:hypothetical protein